jgi:hypothetical protein
MALRPENPGKSRKIPEKIKKVQPSDKTRQTEKANAANFKQL